MIDYLSFLSKYRNLKIFIAPLNWGLGHASRMIPIIEILTKQNEVIIGTDGLALEWLQKEKPDLEFVTLPSYNIQYSKSAMWLSMLWQGPHILKTIHTEKELAQILVEQHGIDMIISDHRLGIISKKVTSIFLGHQLRIPHSNSHVSRIATQIQLKFINEFDEIWVPDFSHNDKLSGMLSEISIKPKKMYIGPLSRIQIHNTSSIKYDIAVVLSGPEPARTLLEESLLNILIKFQDLKFIVVRGTKKKMTSSLKDNIDRLEIIDLANSIEIQDILSQSSLVICRSGYSSIMDLHKIHKNAMLIPTPNQPEQEYLAKINERRNQFYSLDQSNLNLSSFKKAINYFSSLSK